MKGTKMKRGRKSRVNKLLVALIAVMMVAVYGLAPIQAVTGVAFAEEDWYTMDADGNVVVKDGTKTIDTTFQYNWNGSVTSVTIPASVDTIEKNAFFGCSDLESIIFLGEVPPKSIGEAAFEPDYYYANITVTVPAGTKAAYESALENAAAFYYGTEWTVVEAGGNGGSPVTGDEASLLIFALLAMVSGTYIFARRQRVK